MLVNNKEPGKVLVVSEGVTIEGSKEVTDLGIEDRFDIDVVVHITQDSETQFSVAAQLNLFVDVPFPLSITPRPLSEATGNAVFAALFSQMMPAFGEIMAADIEGRYAR